MVNSPHERFFFSAGDPLFPTCMEIEMDELFQHEITSTPQEFHVAPPPPPDVTRFEFNNGWRAHPQPTELAAIDRLIATCPGPWLAEERLPLDAQVMSVTCNYYSVLGYMAYRVREEKMESPTVTILRIAVLPAWRQKGAGRFLVNEFERLFFRFDPERHGHWAPTIRAVTMVPKHCIEGRLFFGSLGFRVVSGWGDGHSYCLERTHTVSGHCRLPG